MIKRTRRPSSTNARFNKRVNEAVKKAVSSMQEATPGYAGKEEDENWRPITNSKMNRDLSPITQNKMQNIVAWLYDADPIAKRIIDLKADFLVGEGSTVEAEDSEVNNVIQEFWHDSVNNMDLFMPDMGRELGLFGEQIYPAFANDMDGHVRLGYLDPYLVSTVITNPDNCREVIGLRTKTIGDNSPDAESDDKFIGKWRKSQGIPEKKYTKRTFSVIGLNRNVNDKNYGKLTGDAFFFAINKVTNATRGRSDLLSLADWIHNYERFLFNRVERARLLNCFLWDVELRGMDKKQIQNWLQNQGVPRPASLRAHNERVKWNAVVPKLESSDASNEARLFRSHIAGGAGIPVHWLGGGEGLTRATALEMSTPVMKHLKRRQLYLKYMVHMIIRFVIDQAIIAGMLKDTPEKPLNKNVKVTFPALSQKDLVSLSTSLSSIASALVISTDAGLLEKSEAQKHLKFILNLLGGDIQVPHAGKGMEPSEQGAESFEELSAAIENSGTYKK